MVFAFPRSLFPRLQTLAAHSRKPQLMRTIAPYLGPVPALGAALLAARLGQSPDVWVGLASAALATSLPPQVLMVPAAMSASCAFMLPVATAPNTVVFRSGCIRTVRMAREGFLLNFIAAGVISVVCYLVIAA